VKNYTHLFQQLDQAFVAFASENHNCQPREIYDPMEYIMGLGGKRVRPLLTLIACDLFEKEVITAFAPALAMELFHNFTLIHDDIMDNAPLRRGHATVHTKWNTNIAILSGDVMLAKAMERLKYAPPALLPALLGMFSKTAIEVCEGQQLDMNFETQNRVSINDYMHMITLKTAVLLGCSLYMGAICGGAAEADAQHLYAFGKHVGISFQLMDDILDAYADSEKFGKTVGGDIIANKKTYLWLETQERANAESLARFQELVTWKEDRAQEKVREVIALYDRYGVKDLALQEADRHTREAFNHLEAVNANIEKKAGLKAFAEQLLNRQA